MSISFLFTITPVRAGTWLRTAAVAGGKGQNITPCLSRLSAMVISGGIGCFRFFFCFLHESNYDRLAAVDDFCLIEICVA